MSTLTINILIWTYTILVYIIVNLYRRSLKAERIAEAQALILERNKQVIEAVVSRWDEIDTNSVFKSSDTVGSTWDDLMSVKEDLKRI